MLNRIHDGAYQHVVVSLLTSRTYKRHCGALGALPHPMRVGAAASRNLVKLFERTVDFKLHVKRVDSLEGLARWPEFGYVKLLSLTIVLLDLDLLGS